jgi:hypothetical protein
MTPLQLQRNEHHTEKPCPMTTFEVRISSNQMVMLKIEYVETIEQFDSGDRKQLQTVLAPNQALILAATLQKAAALFVKIDSDRVVQ